MASKFSPESQEHLNSIYAVWMNRHDQAKRGEASTSGENDKKFDGWPSEAVIEESDDRINMKHLLAYMAETSVFHGVGKIYGANSWLSKMLWILLFITATVMLLIQLKGLFQEFFSRPVTTEVKLGFSPLALPAVTICNQNVVRRSLSTTFSCRAMKALGLPYLVAKEECEEEEKEDEEERDDDLEYTWLCYDDDCRVQLEDSVAKNLQRRQLILNALKKEKRETRIAAGHQIKDMLISCYMLGHKCTYLNFTHTLSSGFGNCYTISSPWLKANRSGPVHSLEMILNLETEEFLETHKTAYGLRVVLHERHTRPFPTSEGFTAAAGEETNIGLRLTQVRRLGGVYGDCKEDKNLELLTGYKYTIRHCREECLQTLIHDRCRCLKIMEDYDSHPLENSTRDDHRQCKKADRKCVWAAEEKYHDEGDNACTCSTPCMEQVYDTTITSRRWPLFEYLETLEKDVCRRNNKSVKCNTSNDYFSEAFEDRRLSFAKLVIYFERLNYESVIQKPSYDVERFLSDIGGTLGLWIGASVLGLGEFVELVMLLVLRCRRRKTL
ncbi:acid-sensing ion channel 2-like [Pomacea canaliculata]|uniref:acid-sensing ion channel 2-like n=1 Tax=Pomacea canaliculata TaxID=400727 RepID=UPI000D731699|nr:acid-sensing ion channel 2-like [Pomacea canaliculata]